MTPIKNDRVGGRAIGTDRLLVAQALVEPMLLLTHDPVLARYSDTVLRV